MCVYSRTLPWSSVLRMWDMFLCEGVFSRIVCVHRVLVEKLSQTCCSWHCRILLNSSVFDVVAYRKHAINLLFNSPSYLQCVILWNIFFVSVKECVKLANIWWISMYDITRKRICTLWKEEEEEIWQSFSDVLCIDLLCSNIIVAVTAEASAVFIGD